MAKKTSKGMPNLTIDPKERMRGKLGRGHDQPGLGEKAGHKNVVNPHSHMDKLKNC